MPAAENRLRGGLFPVEDGFLVGWVCKDAGGRSQIDVEVSRDDVELS
jgi:hypothetical protein